MEEGLRGSESAAEARPRHPPVTDVPDDRDLESLEALGALVPVFAKALERGEEPRQIPVRVRLGRAQPLEVGDVRVLERLLLEKRQEAREEGAQPVGALVSLPVEPDPPGKSAGQPPDDVVGVGRRDLRARDSRQLGIVERGEVYSLSGQAGNLFRKGSQQALRRRQNASVVRVGAEKEEGFVESDELMRLGSGQAADRTQEPRRLAAVGPARFQIFELRKECAERTAQAVAPRTASTAESLASISTGRFARPGGGDVSWW